jgi:hypothetical protein
MGWADGWFVCNWKVVCTHRRGIPEYARAILKRGKCPPVLEKYTRALYQRGTEIAASRGLILVDTKYEFGKDQNGQIVLIDEIHTPDSSRYFYADGYNERQAANEPQQHTPTQNTSGIPSNSCGDYR